MLLMLASMCSLAKPIHIEVNGGRNVSIPIAVLPFTSNFSHKNNLSEISQIVSADLDSSGQFDLVSIPSSADRNNYNYWRKLGAEYLLTGHVEKNDRGYYDVTIQLIDLFRSTKPKLKVRYTDRENKHLRILSHQISDRIFDSITGVKGYFATKLAYVAVSEETKSNMPPRFKLKISDFDGHNVITLLDTRYPIMSPSWSPDARKLAFVAFENDRASIRYIDLTNGTTKIVSEIPGINGAPAWSPNGKYMAIVLSKDGVPKLYQYSFEANKLQKITKGNFIDTEPSYSPDGKSIIFTSNRGGKPQIYRVTLRTGKVDRMTFEGNYNAKGTISFDNRKLVYLHRDKIGNYNIAVQLLKTGRVMILTNSKMNECPSVAPNGVMVVYSTKDVDRGSLGLVSVDGRQKMRLPISDDIVRHPAWSPYISTHG